MRKRKNILQIIGIQIIILIPLFINGKAAAQYPYEFFFVGVAETTNSLVRNYDNDRSVVYYQEGPKGYVALVDLLTNHTRRVLLAEGCTVNDMCVVNDSVFLCGSIKIGLHPHGCIMAMSLDSFYTNNVPVTYFAPSYWIYMSCKRIKWYEYTNSMSVTRMKFVLTCDVDYACDGSESFPPPDFQYSYTDSNNHDRCKASAVLEIAYPFTHYVNPYDKEMRVIQSHEHPETIHDVAVTENYIAFVGVKSGTTNEITLHICAKDNSIIYSNSYNTLTSDFDNYYTFSLGTSSGNPFYRACALDDDHIAIVTQDETSAPSNVLMIRTFDLSTHSMTHTQELSNNTFPYFKDAAYLPDLQMLVLLFHDRFAPTGNNCDIFCLVDPYSSSPSYTQQGMTEDVFQLKFNSLDALTNGYFISTGGKYGIAAKATSLGTGRRCYKVTPYTIRRRDIISSGTEHFFYDYFDLHAAQWAEGSVPMLYRLPTQCVDYP